MSSSVLSSFFFFILFPSLAPSERERETGGSDRGLVFHYSGTLDSVIQGCLDRRVQLLSWKKLARCFLFFILTIMPLPLVPYTIKKLCRVASKKARSIHCQCSACERSGKYKKSIFKKDLMLGVADLNTSEAVSAAEAAIAGTHPVIPLAAGHSDSESGGSSDDSDEENITVEKSSSACEAPGKRKCRKRPKIVEL